jgi:hypothetical protein
VDQHHFLLHIGKRPEGCHHRPRCCLLKGCGQLFWSRHPRSRYCSAECRRAARDWQCWWWSQRYRATENGKQKRREQSKRYRERVRERVREREQQQEAASADAESPREGQRKASEPEVFSGKACVRPGCYELFAIPHEHSNKRFCSVACRLALRRVLDREGRYQARRRRMRCERVTQQARPPDTS